MKVSQTEIASLVSQTGDEYIALLLVPSGGSNRIVKVAVSVRSRLTNSSLANSPS